MKTTPREVLAAVGGALMMLASMATAQLFDAADREREAQLLKAEATATGFAEGMNRLRCVGGLRYDTGTGQYVDVAKRGRDE